MFRRLVWLAPCFLLAACGAGTSEPAATARMSGTRLAASLQANPNIVSLPFERAAYLIVPSGTGSLVRPLAVPRDPGIFVPANASLRFSDTSVLPYVENGSMGQAYRLYRATFSRKPDMPGLMYWIGVLNGGASLEAIAGGFTGSQEFQSRFGSNPKDPAVIVGFYRNVLGREPDAGGLEYWLDLQRKDVPLSSILLGFSESAENKESTAAEISAGVAFKEDGFVYSGILAPVPSFGMSVSGNRFAGASLSIQPDAAAVLPSSGTFTWSLMSKPAASKAQLSAATRSLNFMPDVPGVYVIGLSVADSASNYGASVQLTVTEARLLNQAYLAKNGMLVTLESFSIVDRGDNYVDYNVTYRQTNKTDKAIEEGTLKLYFGTATAMPQYGFFNTVYPGGTLQRSYTFTQLKSVPPAVLEYDKDNFFRDAPGVGSLQWPVPVPVNP